MLLALNLNGGVEAGWTKVTTFVPELLAFLIIVAIGYFVAKAIAKFVDKALERVGFDKAVERGGIKKALAKSQYDASGLVGKLVYWALMLFVLELAFGVFGANPISDLLTRVIAFLPKLVVAILIVVVATAIAAAVREVIAAALGELSYGQALATAAGIAITVIGFFAALDEVQIAPRIVTGLFYALLAIVVGSAVIAIGGSGIQPLRQYWERNLNRISQETENIRQAKQGAGDRIKDRAQELQGQARSAVAGEGQMDIAGGSSAPPPAVSTRPPTYPGN